MAESVSPVVRAAPCFFPLGPPSPDVVADIAAGKYLYEILDKYYSSVGAGKVAGVRSSRVVFGTGVIAAAAAR